MCSKCAAVASIFATILLVPAMAWACGAFVPRVESVEYSDPQQAKGALIHDAERMLYIDRGDGRWTIYQGRSMQADERVEEFAWLLPVPGTPEVEVASSRVFERLADTTRPRFAFEEASDGDCRAEVETYVRPLSPQYGDKSGARAGDLGVISTASPEQVEAGEPVRAVDSGSVGPYEHVTIETREGIDDPGQQAVEWLEEHDYSVESVDTALLQEYLADGMNLLAMRLRAEAGAEDVQPVAITVELDRPISPMRLSQAGAGEETDIVVWIAAKGRSVPIGWPRVEIDEGLVNWTNGGKNYSDVVAAAIEEAGGRGFVTDYAMPTGDSDGPVWTDRQSEALEWLSSRGRIGWDLTWDVLVSMAGDAPGFATIVREELPMPGRGPLLTLPRVKHFTGPEDLLGNLRGRFKRYLAPCLEREFQRDEYAGGTWAATIEDQSQSGVRVVDVESDFSDSFQGCVGEGLQSFVETADYPPDVFPIQVELAIPNPYDFMGNDEGFPALGTRMYEGRTDVDWPRLIKRVNDEIVPSLKRAQRRLDETQWITRLSSVVSRDALIEDVAFAWLTGKSSKRPATRQATRIIQCEETRKTTRGDDVYELRHWSVNPDHGEPVEGWGRGESGEVDWPVGLDDRDAARLVVEYDPEDPLFVQRPKDEVDGNANQTSEDNSGERRDNGDDEQNPENDAEDNPEEQPEDNSGADGEAASKEELSWWKWAGGAAAVLLLVVLLVRAVRGEKRV